jgi:hypothetical protein
MKQQQNYDYLKWNSEIKNNNKKRFIFMTFYPQCLFESVTVSVCVYLRASVFVCVCERKIELKWAIKVFFLISLFDFVPFVFILFSSSHNSAVDTLFTFLCDNNKSSFN